ncbi:hypothetical protein SpCBS45565_g04400 [Spizellomyces sp. 'palustris']|nr:hypothetical protein SpCBS45565_g04400 [Spizellomyces sp. 'palustris']
MRTHTGWCHISSNSNAHFQFLIWRWYRRTPLQMPRTYMRAPICYTRCSHHSHQEAYGRKAVQMQNGWVREALRRK